VRTGADNSDVAKLDAHISDDLKRRLDEAQLPWGPPSQACLVTAPAGEQRP